jgi:hypothetical protein
MSGYSVKSTDDDMPVVAAIPGGAQTNFYRGDGAKGQKWLDNAEFIAHARTDIPCLLEALAAAEQRIQELEAERAIQSQWADVERKRAEVAEQRIARLEETLKIWAHDSHLQTYEDRERFRAASRAVLADGPARKEPT